jgi:multiple sugar transport system ATP-binding protein
VAEVLAIGRLLNRRPSALSGGDMQRVAIGRALVRRPKALLMDEPIGALDAKLREQMRAEIKRLHIARNSTSVYVTHDQIEAMSLADRIVVMHDGVLQQVGGPDEVYLHPANLFVAQFVGSPVMNVADVSLEGGGEGAMLRLGAGDGFRIPDGVAAHLPPGAGIRLGVRPEAVLLSQSAAPGHIATEVTNIEPLGSHDIVVIEVGGATFRARAEAGFARGEGEKLWVALDPERVHFFDRDSGRSLRKAG